MLPNTQNLSILSAEDKAAAINLAFLLDLFEYDTFILNIVSKTFTRKEKMAIYDFWCSLCEATARASLCMMDYEGLI